MFPMHVHQVFFTIFASFSENSSRAQALRVLTAFEENTSSSNQKWLPAAMLITNQRGSQGDYGDQSELPVNFEKESYGQR